MPEKLDPRKNPNELRKITKQAFSLIEIAVVIVILGVLIAGLVQSSRIISNMRLNVARDVTQSSAMPWINYIVTWYDSTAHDAFMESETDDGDSISRWNGAEIRYTDRINLIQNDNTKRPTYASNGMSGLPSVKFDGVNDIMESEFLNQDVLTYRSGTIFAVFEPKTVTSASKKTIFFNPSDCDTELDFGHGFGNVKGALGVASAVAGEACSTTYATQSSGDLVIPNEKIVTTIVIHQTPVLEGSVNNIKIYRNGNLWTSNQVDAKSFNSPTIASSQKYSSGTNKFYVGGKKTPTSEKAFFEGLLGEMIIFNRSLNNEDRNEIERYLGKKWSIKIKFNE